MSDSRPTPAPEFQDDLIALMARMAKGLGRQAAIDRLVELGLDEDAADDQEATLRRQLRNIQRGLEAITRDMGGGLAREEAIARCQRLGFSEEAATHAVDTLQVRRRGADDAARRVCADVGDGHVGRATAVARLREIGLGEAEAGQLVAWQRELNAHLGAARLRFGALAVFLALAASATLTLFGERRFLVLSFPAWQALAGGLLMLSGRLILRRFADRAPAGGAAGPPSLMGLAALGLGRGHLAREAASRGLPARETSFVIVSGLDRLATFYYHALLIGLAFLAGALWLGWRFLEAEPAPEVLLSGPLPLATWGACVALTSASWWRRFSAP